MSEEEERLPYRAVMVSKPEDTDKVEQLLQEGWFVFRVDACDKFLVYLLDCRRRPLNVTFTRRQFTNTSF